VWFVCRLQIFVVLCYTVEVSNLVVVMMMMMMEVVVMLALMVGGRRYVMI